MVGAGTPIKAPAAGKVILIGYFFNGLIQCSSPRLGGLISMFCHMSKVDVKLGPEPARGRYRRRWRHQPAPPVPHMHWNVSLNRDARVGPPSLSARLPALMATCRLLRQGTQNEKGSRGYLFHDA